jgi:vancomycin resistance protein VanJ
VLVPLHTGIALCYWALRWLGGDSLWYVDALGYVLPWVLLPTLLLLPTAIYGRCRVVILLAILPAVLLVLTYGPLFLPRWPVGAIAEPSFSVMTYNVCYKNTDGLAIAGVIEAEGADVLVLRELEPAMAKALEERLEYRYPYRRVEPGCGFFSRFPIMGYEAYRLSEGAYDFAQQLVLDVDGRRVTFLSVHPKVPRIEGFHPFGLPLGIPTGLASGGRDADIRALLHILEDLAGPLVVLGDFNLADQHELYSLLTSRLIDSHRESGWGMGFTFSPSGGPGLAMWRIDLVLHSPHMVALSTRVGDYGGSDHRPLVARLAFGE